MKHKKIFSAFKFPFSKQEVRPFLNIAIPILLSGLGQSLFSIIDGMMVGQILGGKALSALAIGGSFFFVIVFLGIGASSIFAPLYASAKALDNKDRIIQIFKQTFVFNMLIASLIVILNFALLPLLQYLKKSPETLELSYQYLNIRIWSAYGIMGFLSLKRLAEGLSRTHFIFYTVLLSCVINIFLNYVLIDGKWFFPALGLRGTAWSLLSAGITEMTILFFFLYRDAKCRWFFEQLFREKSSWWPTFKISYLAIPAGLYGFFESSLFYLSTFVVGLIASELTAIHYINIHIMALVFRFIYAISVANMVRIGHYFGLANKAKMKEIFYLSLSSLAIVLFVSAFVFLPFAMDWVLLFAKKKDNMLLLEKAAHLLFIAWTLKIFDALQMLFNSTLKGIHCTKTQATNGFIAYILFALPLCYYFGLILQKGIEGVWWALCFSMFISALLSGRDLFKRFA